MWVYPTHCNVALDIVSYFIFLEDGVGIFDDEDAFSVIFVDFVAGHTWKRLFFNANTRL